MKNTKKEKKALSAKEWIFCIIGILSFTSLMVLPPVFRIVFAEDDHFVPNPLPTPTEENSDNKEPNSKPTAPINDEKLKKMICTKKDLSEEDSKDEVQFIFAHEEGELKIYTEMITKQYDISQVDQSELFSNDKKICEAPPKEYLTIPGFNYACTPLPDAIQTTRKFDLENFSDTTIIVNKETEIVSVPYFFNQSISIIKVNLENQNYVCEIQNEEEEDSLEKPTDDQDISNS